MSVRACLCPVSECDARADEDTIDDIPAKSSGDQHCGETNSPTSSSSGDLCSSAQQQMAGGGMATPRPSSPINGSLNIISMELKASGNAGMHPNLTSPQHDYKTLPWKPKVRSRDLEVGGGLIFH